MEGCDVHVNVYFGRRKRNQFFLMMMHFNGRCQDVMEETCTKTFGVHNLQILFSNLIHF